MILYASSEMYSYIITYKIILNLSENSLTSLILNIKWYKRQYIILYNDINLTFNIIL